MGEPDLVPVALLPCPFCGGEPVLDDLGDPHDDSFVHCTHCEVQQIANYTSEKAAARWNTRSTPSSPPTDEGLREAQRSALQTALIDGRRRSEWTVGSEEWLDETAVRLAALTRPVTPVVPAELLDQVDAGLRLAHVLTGDVPCTTQALDTLNHARDAASSLRALLTNSVADGGEG